MSNDIETRTTFEVAAEPTEAWRMLEVLRAERLDPDDGAWWLPGFECRATVEQEETDGTVELRKVDEPCAGTTISITIEHASSGSRITMVQSGFDPAFVEFAGPSFWTHAEHIWADAELFFRTGVVAGRAWRPWAPLGFTTEAVPGGVAVGSVHAGSWAERIGLSPGDVLLTVAGAPVYEARDIGLLERVLSTGDEARATWISGDERRKGTARL